jgi:hypothetical protein
LESGVFWIVTVCRLVCLHLHGQRASQANSQQDAGGKHSLLFNLENGYAIFFRNIIEFLLIGWPYIPEYSNFHSYNYENSNLTIKSLAKGNLVTSKITFMGWYNRCP